MAEPYEIIWVIVMAIALLLEFDNLRAALRERHAAREEGDLAFLVTANMVVRKEIAFITTEVFFVVMGVYALFLTPPEDLIIAKVWPYVVLLGIIFGVVAYLDLQNTGLILALRNNDEKRRRGVPR